MKEKLKIIGAVVFVAAMGLLMLVFVGSVAKRIYNMESNRTNGVTVDTQCVTCCEAGNYKSLEKFSACASNCKSLVDDLEKDTDTSYVPQHCEAINESFRAGVRCFGPTVGY